MLFLCEAGRFANGAGRQAGLDGLFPLFLLLGIEAMIGFHVVLNIDSRRHGIEQEHHSARISSRP